MVAMYDNTSNYRVILIMMSPMYLRAEIGQKEPQSNAYGATVAV